MSPVYVYFFVRDARYQDVSMVAGKKNGCFGAWTRSPVATVSSILARGLNR